ncbi:hypothetical protein B4U80_10087 [Leptotrombidium deliense]|uniref:ZP domain-containing protein n=1 Tax=Leptotrombidium deliense TaxID=299467 RepID=A0A443SH42_9ACAR|nr:hypothetical protein B4U80_10087 [Leptotrombidium deliense]
MCDFTVIKGKILKTVDSVYQDVNTVEGCKQKCLDSPYRCFSFDFGDPSNSVCRTSHLDRASLSHIENPYLTIKDAVTYELASCYNVSIFCRAREMVAYVETNKLFNGKIYSKSKPNSCVNDVTRGLKFEISMPYNDLLCDVKQKEQGKFNSDIIIQHHDMVVTTKDIGLSVNCNYDLSNKSVTNKQTFNVEGGLDAREEENIHSQTVNAPNITMKVTDIDGNDIKSAQVGDRLILRIQISDKNTPYEIFVRELVAIDGVDNADIVLIDSPGCPTDTSIMGFVEKETNDMKSLEIPFNAFKFPTSDIVQFQALVTPCIQSCEPVTCVVQSSEGKAQETNSFGKRRRRRNAKKEGFEEEVVVLQSIKILDSFGFQGKEKDNKVEAKDDYFVLNEENNKTVNSRVTPCINVAGLTIFCVIFLLIQLTLVFVWAIQWNRKNKSLLKNDKLFKVLSNMPYSPTVTMSGVAIGNCHRYSNFMKTQNE